MSPSGNSLPPHYRILGLTPDSTEEEIRAAYRRLAKQHHPDANQGDPDSEEQFKRVAAAYKILSDPSARLQYDRVSGLERKPDPPPKTTASARPAQKQDLTVRLFVTLEQAVKGGGKDVKIPRKVPCPVCKGTGHLGEQRETCKGCSGEGIVKKTTSVEITYPPGVRQNAKLRLSGYGHRLPPGNFSGDLVVEFSLKPHKYLTINGNDLHYTTVVGIDLFIEGGKVNIPTPYGASVIELPSRVADGAVWKIPGKALPAYQGLPQGDLLVTIRLCVPKKLSTREREKIHELMKLPAFNPPVDAEGFIPKGD